MKKQIFTIYLGLFSTFVSLFTNCKHTEKRMTFDEFRSQSQATMDTIAAKINKKIRIVQFADSLAEMDSTANGLKKLDSLVLLYPGNDMLYLSRGNWYFNRKQYHQALSEFAVAQSVAGHGYPILSEKIALTYLMLNQKEAALEYYRDAAQYGSQPNYKIAEIHESNNQTDSAVYYYSAYYNKNKNDSNTKKHLDSLALILSHPHKPKDKAVKKKTKTSK